MVGKLEFRTVRKVLTKRVARVIIILILIWLLGAFGMYLFERNIPDSPFNSFPNALWCILIYITSGFEEFQPKTLEGRAVSVVIVIMSIGLISILTASIASALIERHLKEVKGMGNIRLRNHIVVCGWSKKVENIIRQLHAPVIKRKKPIVVIAKAEQGIEFDDTDKAFDDVYFISGEPTNARVLERANVKEADTVLILADPEEQKYADAKSILVALAIESLNPNIHTCVEVVDPDQIVHFSRTQVDEIISRERLGELLIAQCAMNHGISEVYNELLTFQEHGNEIYIVETPPEYAGKSFREIASVLLEKQCILLGVKSKKGIELNPKPTYKFKKEDKVVVIAYSRPELK